jgi:hypothetical protein
VVHDAEAVRFPPQDFVHQDRLECRHGRRIPT